MIFMAPMVTEGFYSMKSMILRHESERNVLKKAVPFAMKTEFRAVQLLLMNIQLAGCCYYRNSWSLGSSWAKRDVDL